MMILLMAVTNQSEGIINLVALGYLCTWALALGYNLLLMVLGPAAVGILADTRSLAQALNPLNACGIAAANPCGYLAVCERWWRERGRSFAARGRDCPFGVISANW